MRHEEGTFSGARSGARRPEIYFQGWVPDGEPKAVLLIVHGLGEHSGRYGNLVQHFVPLGYATYGLDHLGHGRSGGRRKYVERIEDYTRTLKIYCDYLRSRQPGKPIFLVGHSMGGLIGSLYLLDYQGDLARGGAKAGRKGGEDPGFFLVDHEAGLAGAVISAPAVKVPAGISPLTVAMAKALSVLSPTLGVLGLEFAGLSRDPAVVQAYVADPLVYTGKATARLSAEMLRGMKRVEEEAATISLPILIVQGSADRIVDPGGASMLYEKVASADKTLKVYDGLYHEVFNEPERAEVLHDVEGWLAAHLPGG